jgi:hypothetical protein
LFGASYDEEDVRADWNRLLSSDAKLRREFVQKQRTAIMNQVREYNKVICK